LAACASLEHQALKRSLLMAVWKCRSMRSRLVSPGPHAENSRAASVEHNLLDRRSAAPVLCWPVLDGKHNTGQGDCGRARPGTGLRGRTGKTGTPRDDAPTGPIFLVPRAVESLADPKEEVGTGVRCPPNAWSEAIWPRVVQQCPNSCVKCPRPVLNQPGVEALYWKVACPARRRRCRPGICPRSRCTASTWAASSATAPGGENRQAGPRRVRRERNAILAAPRRCWPRSARP